MSTQHYNMNNALMMFGAIFGVNVRKISAIPPQGCPRWIIETNDVVFVEVEETREQTWNVSLFYGEDALMNKYEGFHDYIQVMRTIGSLTLPHLPLEVA